MARLSAFHMPSVTILYLSVYDVKIALTDICFLH